MVMIFGPESYPGVDFILAELPSLLESGRGVGGERGRKRRRGDGIECRLTCLSVHLPIYRGVES